MLDILDYQPLIMPLTVEQRKAILRRAMNSTPYFNLVTLPVNDSHISNVPKYQSKVDINLDYYLTEVKTNLPNVIDVTNINSWSLNAFIANTQKSLYGFNVNQPLTPPFIANNTNFNAALNLGSFLDDRQVERMPFVIKNGDEVIVQIQALTQNDIPIDFQVLLCGFNLIAYPYITPDEQKRINSSLDDDPIFQSFTIDVEDKTERSIHNIENDSRPRLILGFGIADNASSDITSDESSVSIFDATRHIQLTNVKIPVEMIAPRVHSGNAFTSPNGLRTHIYYLPVEYYWMPLGNLRFEVDNDTTLGDGGYQLVIFTRTV